MDFNFFTSQICLLSDDELFALAKRCTSLYEDRQRIKRNELRKELAENLQKAMSAVLANGFNLFIENTTTKPGYENVNPAVYFTSDDFYSIEIDD